MVQRHLRWNHYVLVQRHLCCYHYVLVQRHLCWNHYVLVQRHLCCYHCFSTKACHSIVFIVDEFADEMGCDRVLHADNMRACWGCVFSSEGG